MRRLTHTCGLCKRELVAFTKRDLETLIESHARDCVPVTEEPTVDVRALLREMTERSC
jgi:hypothetical protein